MAKRSFVISDTHFGHANMLSFLDEQGAPVRPFPSVEAMDECMVERWNETVRPGDRVYHLGDVAMKKQFLPILARLNGAKVLLKGNHDIFKLNDYLPYFEDIRAYRVFPKHGAILSHIPVHPEQLSGRFCLNVHGHTHQRRLADKRYLNVCVEQTAYAPVDLGLIFSRLDEAKKALL